MGALAFQRMPAVFCALNATILLVYITAKIKMSFVWEDVFFSSVSRLQAHLAKRKRIGWSTKDCSLQPFSQDYNPVSYLLSENALDDQLASTPEAIELCMTS